MSEEKTEKTGLELMRVEFSEKQIGKLPKPTKAQTDSRQKSNCSICGGWHHPQATHLDYVGHAALTDRLLDVDPRWTWEPLAIGEDGLPTYDNQGGLWIKLTVLDMTRLGYGTAGNKKGGDAIKEIIGDALRNAAMRFGAALELWHKGDLHGNDAGTEPANNNQKGKQNQNNNRGRNQSREGGEDTTQEKFQEAKDQLLAKVEKLREASESTMKDIEFLEKTGREILKKSRPVSIEDVRKLWTAIMVDKVFDLATGERIP